MDGFGDEEEGPKTRKSLSSEGVRGRGREISSSSGREKSGGGGFRRGLEYGSRGSCSMWGRRKTVFLVVDKPKTRVSARQ